MCRGGRRSPAARDRWSKRRKMQAEWSEPSGGSEEWMWGMVEIYSNIILLSNYIMYTYEAYVYCISLIHDIYIYICKSKTIFFGKPNEECQGTFCQSNWFPSIGSQVISVKCVTRYHWGTPMIWISNPFFLFRMLAIHMEMGTPSSRIKAIGSIEKYIYVHIHIHIHTNAYAYIIYIYTCIPMLIYHFPWMY